MNLLQDAKVDSNVRLLGALKVFQEKVDWRHIFIYTKGHSHSNVRLMGAVRLFQRGRTW